MDLYLFFEKINRQIPFVGCYNFDEPMANHTTFRTGGPADLWIKPEKRIFPDWAAALLREAKALNIPVFILGGGANLLVSDRGIRGIILDTGFREGIEIAEKGEGPSCLVNVLCGTTMDNLTGELACLGYSGLEFLAGMPGTIGGAVLMNARYAEKSVSDVLVKTEILDEKQENNILPFCKDEFSYKKSPFQNRNILILSACFRVEPGEKPEILTRMEKIQLEREEKGHYRYPSAGSVFKNNRDFGAPTGKIIADLGLRGFRKGGAEIADWHGNFIINTGNASSADIRFLMEETIRQVKEARGFELEPEILFAGEW